MVVLLPISQCLCLLVVGDRSGVFAHPVFWVVLWDVGVVWCSLVSDGVGGQLQIPLAVVGASGVGGWRCACTSACCHHSVVVSGGE